MFWTHFWPMFVPKIARFHGSFGIFGGPNRATVDSNQAKNKLHPSHLFHHPKTHGSRTTTTGTMGLHALQTRASAYSPEPSTLHGGSCHTTCSHKALKMGHLGTKNVSKMGRKRISPQMILNHLGAQTGCHFEPILTHFGPSSHTNAPSRTLVVYPEPCCGAT